MFTLKHCDIIIVCPRRHCTLFQNVMTQELTQRHEVRMEMWVFDERQIVARAFLFWFAGFAVSELQLSDGSWCLFLSA